MERALRLCLGTAFLARLAEEGMAVAVVLLALDRTGGAAQGAFLLTAWMAPHIAAAPLAGALAERVRRPALFYVGALGGFAAAVLALAFLTGRAPTVVTLLAAGFGGSCGPVVSGGMSSLVALLVPEGRGRDRAYAWDSAVYNAASVAGPALAGVTAAVASPAVGVAALGVAAAAAALSAGLLLSGPAAPPGALAGAGPKHRLARGSVGPEDGPGRRALRTELRAGVAAVCRVRELRAVTAATCLGFLGLGGLTTTAVLLSAERGRPGDGGVLMTAFAVGALVGALAVDRLWPRVPAERLVGAALLGTGVALAAAATVPSPLLRAALFAAAGLCDGPLLTATLRIRADHAPAGLRTQVFTLGAGLKISAAACGAALTGLATADVSPALLLLVAAALQVAAAGLHHLARRGPTRPPRSVPNSRCPRDDPASPPPGL
ncbi:MFS transporter [Streptomyces lateritius]|uniref:MFS transporter n=1 Tax=Streptomyces lateritius TaxID=67313 RepID=UPI001677805F|nr:MFS transporter [Streptomyces lateritius]GGT79022.1 hypothetical protein GCM10010272_23550 [Streptomyces lateritius]